MTGTTLNSALLSLNQNLSDPGLLIDDRTEEQYLNFITGFSRLINFYSKTNNKDGSWEPFLLKDPVFLSASISQFDSAGKAKLFKNACAQCRGAVDRSAANDLTALNPLFNQIFDAFDNLLKWSTYMYDSELAYALKNDTIGEIEVVFATYFWAFADLMNELALSGTFSGLINVDQGFTYRFETNLWSSQTNRKPYQKVLNLIKPLNEMTLEDLVLCIKDHGSKVLQFQHQVVKKSSAEYRVLTSEKTAYPDTLLLRTFLELLKVNQQDLNGLTEKHLAFYYDKILRQLNRNAKADQVYICADLVKPDNTFLLTKGTEFSAGVNSAKENIIFKSVKNYFLNPAKIITAHTLLVKETQPERQHTYVKGAGPLALEDPNAEKKPTYIKGAGPLALDKLNPEKKPSYTKGAGPLALDKEAATKTPLYAKGLGPRALDNTMSTVSILMNQHKEVDTLKMDENGTLLSWDTFGNPNLSSNIEASLGIAFASPMLLLKEGKRTIDLVFTLDQPTQATILTKADFYLSTKAAWFPLKGKQTNQHLPKGLIDTLYFTFELSAVDPPIEKFELNPDGYTENWPLLKVVYHTINDLATPPMIKGLEITTSVEDLKSLVASNDNGALVTAKPFMPFGPIVQRDSSMYIGNAEIFSKPLEFLSFNISWDKLPQNFGVYYDLYNAYLGHELLAEPASVVDPDKEAKSGKKSIRSKIAGWLGGIWTTVTKSNPIVTAITAGAKWIFSRSKKVIEKIEEKKEEREEEANKKETEEKVPLGVFNNAGFKVGFQLLSNHKWDDIKVDRELDCTFTDGVFECIAPNFDDGSTTDAVSLFNQNDDKDNTLEKKIAFVYHKPETSNTVTTDAESTEESEPVAALPYNPALQNADMLYSEKTAAGFIKISLSDPFEGFGFDVYPQVISQVTLVNAANLINATKTPAEEGGKDEEKTTEETGADAGATEDVAPITAAPAAEDGTKVDAELAVPAAVPATPPAKPEEPKAEEPVPGAPLPLPNPPYAPLISSLTASYQAKVSHTFHYQQETDPIQCYHYSVFNNYLVYDSTKDASEYQKNIGIELCGKNVLRPYLPMFSGVDYNAVLYLEMEKVIVGNEVSIFIELNQSANPVDKNELELEYFYLSDSTWKPLEIIYDGSKGLKCSGIITFEFPADMNTENLQRKTSNFWIAIGLNGNPDLIGKTTFLKTNGLKLERAGMDYLDDTVSPVIEPGKVTAPITAIPALSEIIQPFPSFGGKAAEKDQQKNSRVANQLKTKGRPITINDFNRFVMQDFTSIFYSKVNFDKATRTVSIRLVKKIENEFASNAFLPMVSACEELEVETAIKDQSELENLEVKNFEIEYVTVNATVYIQPEYDIKGASNRITQALKVFLSPWIDSSQKQVTIDQGVTDAQVAAFITSFQEVSGIEDVSFQLAGYDNGKKVYNSEVKNNVKPTDPSTLLVPNIKHGIEWKKAV